jgi:hypothetical protein
MRVLVFGARGWIGQQFINNTQHKIIEATTRPENFQDAFDEIQQVNPDCVISFLGRTYGKDHPIILRQFVINKEFTLYILELDVFILILIIKRFLLKKISPISLVLDIQL